MAKDALQRFAEKCEFMPGSGCVLWRAACTTNEAGDTKRPIFKDKGKRWSARRWAAINIHGLEVTDEHIVTNTCGDDLCVQHVTSAIPVGNLRQHYLLMDYGYEERMPEEERAKLPRPDHNAIAFHARPSWLPKPDPDEVPF